VLLQFFDKDDSGFITVDELEGALKEHGDAAVVAAHISEILQDVDKDKVRALPGGPAHLGQQPQLPACLGVLL
jgi:hypothetical protein